MRTAIIITNIILVLLLQRKTVELIPPVIFIVFMFIISCLFLADTHTSKQLMHIANFAKVTHLPVHSMFQPSG
jgi:hypothetical protein